MPRLRLYPLAAGVALAALPLSGGAASAPVHARAVGAVKASPSTRAAVRGAALNGLAAVGRAQAIEGFVVTPRAVIWAREAGAADYVAGRGHVFLLVDLQIKRAGGHGSYYADPQDFVVQTSRGDIVDSEPFGMSGEFTSRHVYTQPVTGWIGFEAPAGDRGLRLLWQPGFGSNPDAQAEWAIGRGGASVRYYR